MNKKDIILLISPSIVFVCIGLFAFLVSRQIRDHQAGDRAERLKWATLFRKLDSGSSVLNYDAKTEDSILSALRWSIKMQETEREVNASTGREVRDFIWFALTGIICQVMAILVVRHRLRKYP
jgi:hypothetical protein